MNFQLLSEKIYFLDLNLIGSSDQMFHLTQILFYKKPTFFHIHIDSENNEKSLLLSENVFCNEFLSLFQNTKLYYCYQITNTMEYIDESGLVNMVSSLFSDRNVPILYITTLRSNFVLFETKYLKNINF